MPDTIGKKLFNVRRLHRLSMAELASRAGVSRGYISMLESGKIQKPSVAKLDALARALFLPLEYFVRTDAAIPRDFLDVPGNAVGFLTAPDSEPYLAAAIAAWERGIPAEAFRAIIRALGEARGQKKGESAKREKEQPPKRS